jgi:CelD/BcsL family acetyltransferase involved in cellulose biosynthesis
VFRSIEELAPLRGEWDRLVEAVGGDVTHTYDWCRAWWTHYRGRREPRVYLFRDGDELVGVAPMCIDRLRLGPLSLRIAKIMGSDHTQVVCDLPVRPTWADAACEELLRRLMIDERCEAVHFGPLPAAGPRLAALRAASRRRPDLARLHRDRVITQHGTIDLPDTFDDYIRSLSRNQRANIRKDIRRLEDDFEVRVEMVEDPDELVSELNEFVRMHGRQWRSVGRCGHFGDWPDAEGFHRSLVRAMRGMGRVRFLRLRADDRIVARQYAYVFGDTCHCRFAARAPGDRWRRYGLGRISLVKLIEHMIGEGIRRLDVGIGHYEYKTRLGGLEHDVNSILLVANRGAVLGRARLFAAAADLLDRLYYRCWYCRIAPHVPGPTRSLQQLWIRSRL